MTESPHVVNIRAAIRLDRYLTRQLAHVSRNRIQYHIDKGDVLVDGRRVRPSHRLQGGEVLTFATHLDRSFDKHAEAVPVRIVHEDSAILVVDKPAGLLVHPVGTEFRRTLLGSLHLLLRTRGEPTDELGIVHRLDRWTSGLMVLGKTLAARRALSRAVETRHVRREYIAVVCGQPPKLRGSIAWPIRRDPRRRSRMQALTDEEARQALAEVPQQRVSSSGFSDRHADLRPRAATTHYVTLCTRPGWSLLRLRLDTGRTHQIRVHAQALGVPLFGDPLYGPAQPPVVGGDFARPALHARRLAFPHPTDERWMRFRVPLPADMRQLLDELARTGSR